MEAYKLKTLDDLLASPEERVELIDGEVMRRPMARSEHGIVQTGRFSSSKQNAMILDLISIWRRPHLEIRW